MNYKSLTNFTRKLNYFPNQTTGTGYEADSLSYRPRSVDWQGNRWYRVMGDAGTRIREGDRHGWCKTTCPRYLPSGSHPKTPGELVDNVKVCLNCQGVGNLGWGLTPTILGCNHNEYKFHDAATAKIRHCGDYFVYYLTQERRSYISRYCTE